MMSSSPTPPKRSRLRLANTEWYGWFWTVVTVLMFIWAFGIAFSGDRPYAWLVGSLLALQLGLYIRAIAFNKWPLASGWLAAYFIPGPIMWAVITWIDPRLWWMGMMYFGQMWGCLPPRAAIPGTAVIVLGVVLSTNGWHLPAIVDLGQFVGFGFGWIGMAAVYLWISQVIRSSDERARLIRELEVANHELVVARRSCIEGVQPFVVHLRVQCTGEAEGREEVEGGRGGV